MSINDFVVDVLVRDKKLKAESVWTVENHEKYSTLKRSDDDARRKDAGREVFSLKSHSSPPCSWHRPSMARASAASCLPVR
ncbi:hypothetical protein [Burkholderia sp. D-99]|uniref:hypothetical protein n=1 Tax=Burkholderia sp. D-99 TaxID=2717316 RepID=UPI001AA0F69E|nr:hypothetical protein [Burkholderia sp. D-99]NHV29603.1 hypothetical protein [Burkholderia sp. D-99]